MKFVCELHGCCEKWWVFYVYYRKLLLYISVYKTLLTKYVVPVVCYWQSYSYDINFFQSQTPSFNRAFDSEHRNKTLLQRDFNASTSKKFRAMHACSVLKLSCRQINLKSTESCFRHPLFDLRGTRKVEIRHTNFHFSSKKVTSKSRKVEVFDLTIVKKLSTFRPKKVEKSKS